MNISKARSIQSIQWQPAERLGQLSVEANLRSWLIGKGLLTLRLKAVCGERFALHLVDYWSGVLQPTHKSVLKTEDQAGLFRDVEMFCGEQVWVFAQTVIPDSTLSAHPWLAELGDSSLGETLNDLSGIERGIYEFAWLPAEDSVAERALRDAQVKPAGLWARRYRLSIRNRPLLIQELFLPAVGRT